MLKVLTTLTLLNEQISSSSSSILIFLLDSLSDPSIEIRFERHLKLRIEVWVTISVSFFIFRSMKKVIGLFVVLGVSIGVGSLYWQNSNWESQKVPESYKVLDDLETVGIYKGEEIKLKTLDGEVLSLNSFKGKVLILSFWATWCEPCVEEFPSFVKLMDAFPDKIRLVAISHDYEEQEVRDFVKAFDGYRPNLILTMDEGKALSQAFGVDRLPEGFIFDQEGRLQKKIIGIQDWASPGALEFFKQM